VNLNNQTAIDHLPDMLHALIERMERLLPFGASEEILLGTARLMSVQIIDEYQDRWGFRIPVQFTFAFDSTTNSVNMTVIHTVPGLFKRLLGED
jgi:hypothetical protein